MSRWAIGVRLPGSTDSMIQSAIDNAEIIRTHLLRPTWHVVSPDDIYWLLDLSAPGIKKLMRRRLEELGLTESVLHKSKRVIEKAITKKGHLTRDELKRELENSGIQTGDNRASHIFINAELEQLICSGRARGAAQTYALLEERVPKKKTLKKDEALAELARKYFETRGPATLKDFTWWSGLSTADSKKAIEMTRDNFISETIGSQVYIFPPSVRKSSGNKDSLFLLPAFDEFIISYTDRSASLDSENIKKAIIANGIFRPVVVANGRAIATWGRTIKPGKVEIKFTYFKKPGATGKRLIEKELARIALFFGRETEIV